MLIDGPSQEERQKAATLVQQAWSGGYRRACEVGGATFVAMALMEGGVEKRLGGVLDSYDHTHWRRCGIRVRPTVRTPGANLGERDEPFSFACVGTANCYGERNVEVCPGESKHAMKHEAGIRDQR